MRAWIAALAATLFFSAAAFADGPASTPPLRPPPGSITPKVDAAQAPGVEKGQRGVVVLASGMDYAIPPGFSYFSPAAARDYIERSGRPAPDGEIQGLIAPANADFFSPDFWGGVIAYQPIGHVKAEGQDKITQPAFLAEVQEARRGLALTPPQSFVVEPAYDPSAAKIAWAESYASAGPADKSMRHEVRALGREGVLSITTLVTPAKFDEVKTKQSAMLKSLVFPAGKTYADFVEGADRAADFDIAGMISGKRLTPLEPPVVEEPAASEDAASGNWMAKAFPWIGAALVIIPAVLWIVYGRRRRIDDDDEDPNLTPQG